MKGDSIAGRYRVDRVLGSGSSGFVVAARHIQTREKVALKVLTNDAPPPAVELPSSPHIARVIDSGYTQERQGYVATEMLEGQTIAKLLERGPVATRLAVSWMQQAGAGLAVAHAAGMCHGHLKPQNLFLTTDGVLEILDFGMNMPLIEETDQESSAAWLHSPAYLAPEQLREATFGPRADVWALGVILHQLITGRLPFDAETIAGMFVAVAYDAPSRLEGADVPEALADVVARCLAKNASERPTIAQLQDLLAPFAPAESMPPQLAMTIEVEDEPDPRSEEAPPVASSDLIEPSPASRMKAAFEKASSSSAPPLPSSRLGARPRVAPMAQIRHELGQRVGRGWLSARLMAQQLAPDVRTHAERDLQRRRWGAMGVVAAAAVLGVASIFATPEGSASAAMQLEAEPVTVAELPLEFGLSGFIPPSFALPEKDEQAKIDRTPVQVAPLPVWTPPPRARLIVREDPYLRPFASPAAPPAKLATTPPPARVSTHPRGLPTTRR